MLPKVLKNFNLFIDGRGYAGLVEEVTLPKLVTKTEEYRMGGLVAPIQVDMGIEKLECEFTLSEYDAYVIKRFGINDTSSQPIASRGGVNDSRNSKTIPFTLRGGLSDETNNRVAPVVISLEGHIIELDLGQWKAGDKVSLKIRLALQYYRLQIDNENLIEIDIANGIRGVDGINKLNSTDGSSASALGIFESITSVL